MSFARRIPALLTLLAAGTVSAQELPTTQPAYLTIYMETLKPGHGAAHEATEAGWPAAFARANSPTYYLALESMTGPAHIWFVVPYPSYTAEADDMKRNADNAELSKELQRLSTVDGEHLESSITVNAVARPDLSHGGFPDLTKTRYWDVTVMRVRAGHEEQFAEAAKAYAAIATRGAPEASWRVYQVMAGMPGSQFLIFSAFDSYAAFDEMIAGGNRMMQAATAQERELMQRFSRESIQNVMTNRYALSSTMSYVDAATRAADPAFWAKK